MNLDVIALALLGTDTPPVVAEVIDKNTMSTTLVYDGRWVDLKRVIGGGKSCPKLAAYEQLQADGYELVSPDCLPYFQEGHEELWGRRVKCIVAIDYDACDTSELATAARLDVTRTGAAITDEPMDDEINGMVWIPVVRIAEPQVI